MLLKVSNTMCIKLPVKLSGIQEKCEILRETHELFPHAKTQVVLKETQNTSQVNMCLGSKEGLPPEVSFVSAFSVAY